MNKKDLDREIAEIEALFLKDIESTPPTSDIKAEKEAASLVNEDLEDEAKRQDHERDQGFKGLVHKLVCIFIFVLFCGFVAMVLIFFWHMLSPLNLHFLDDGAIAEIKTILASVSSSALAVKYYQKT